MRPDVAAAAVTAAEPRAMRQRPGEAGGSAGGARVRRAPGDPLAGDVVLGATCIGGARPAWGSVKRWGSACPRSSCAGCAALPCHAAMPPCHDPTTSGSDTCERNHFLLLL
jgi:hypothetical protein